jgi:hypothetical protein
MNELPSTEFRKTFHKLTEEVLVTVNDHGIGYWTPHQITDEFLNFIRGTQKDIPSDVQTVPKHLDPTIPAVAKNLLMASSLSQAERDNLLRKINRD